MPEDQNENENEIVIRISLNTGSWSTNLQELERRIGSSSQSAGYYCTSHTDAKATAGEASGT
jgi:hypothetical protein